MRNVVSEDKFRDFRDLVNSNSSFVYQIYKDKGGKNLFNLVCSCMDWVTVSVRHLENVPEFDKNLDTKCMQVYSLISSIDLIFEAIKQLHRVFVNEKNIPFSGEKKCFKNRLFLNEDDNTYFKTIRACFGAHPVDLKQSNSKRFASWPFESHFNSGDLCVHLYSRDVNEEDLALNLNINELLEFLTTRYDYLDVITGKIQSLFIEYQKSLSNQPIETKSDPLEQLYVLRAESEKRLDNEYYNGEIDDLIMIFEAEVTTLELVSIADSYKGSLLPLIEEIKTNLQTMNIIDLEHGSDLRIRSDLSRELSYELSKFYTWVHDDRYAPLIHYYFERFNDVTNGKFDFNNTDEINLTFLKAKLMLAE
ncbi:hypothetical protein L2747_05180 [Shewanella marinintestina]|uniref:hypothetical protein n=1 Tax=Shewanella marinintestina TaxID=190305 RepID=UPI00200C0233|nr:hypothetical protein [Shewanella marinintestina]MCL1145411.1 hypothetical protein [Shewanella marinintestina]